MIPKNVAIIYHIIPHYRIPIFRLLLENEDVNYELFSGVIPNIEIKILKTNNSDVSFHKLHNIWFLKYFLWQKGIIKMAFSKKFDSYIFLGNMYYISSWVAVIIIKMRKKNIYFWSHGFTRPPKGLKGKLRLIYYSFATGFFLYGNHAKSIFKKNGFKKDNLHLIYNSLDYKTQLSVRKSLTNRNIINCRKSLFSDVNTPIIIFIGRLTETKKLKILLEAIYLLKEEGIKINTLLVGDGEEKTLLQKYCIDLGISNIVHFFGESYDEFANGLLISSSEICVSPGSIGLTAIHSLMFGTPVITHDNFDKQGPEFEAIKVGISGDFFKYNNPEDLAIKISKFLWRLKTNRDKIREDCFRIIDSYYNPYFQMKVFNNVVNS